jgi:aminoglycoside 2'-N-acetyltransferase I
MTPPPVRLRRIRTHDLEAAEAAAIRAVLIAAFADDSPDEQFTEDDWQHAIGGVHVVLDVAGEIVSHASVVERELRVGGRPLQTGYVEAVATAPGWQGRGHGTAVMGEVNEIIREGFELGALGTGSHGFYERLGWRAWRGPTFVREPDGEHRTPDEDGLILVLATPTTPPLDETASISCDARQGDDW